MYERDKSRPHLLLLGSDFASRSAMATSSR